jgi:hypothetical protein
MGSLATVEIQKMVADTWWFYQRQIDSFFPDFFPTWFSNLISDLG